jgi:hypothetical protein
MKQLVNDDLERAVRELRVKLGIDDELQPNMIHILQRMQRLGFITELVRVPDKLMPDAARSPD